MQHAANRQTYRKTPRRSRPRRARRLLGLTLLCVGSLLLVAFISYGSTWREDQLSAERLLSSSEPSKNAVGKFGAVVSHYFFFRGVGVFSFLIDLLIFVWAVKFLKKGPLNLRKTTINTLLLTFYLSALTSFLLPNAPDYLSGGAAKKLITASQQVIGQIGTFLVLIIFCPLFLFYSFFGFKRPFQLLPTGFGQSKKRAPSAGHSPSQHPDSLPLPTHPPLSPEQKALGSSTIPQQETDPFQNNKFHGPIFLRKPIVIPETKQENYSFEIIERSDPVLEVQESNEPPCADVPAGAPTVPAVEPPRFVPSPPPVSATPVRTAVAPTPTHENLPLSQSAPVINADDTSAPPPAPPKQTPSQALPQGVFVSHHVNPAKRVSIHTPAQPLPNPTGMPPAQPALYDPRATLSVYQFPPVELLHQHENTLDQLNRTKAKENEQKIIRAFRNYKIEIVSISSTVGPTVTLYEFVPKDGVTIASIQKRENDIARAIAALSIRIIAPVPGKNVVGIEVPNLHSSTVGLRSLITSEEFRHTKAKLPLALGKTIHNQDFIVDLAAMPHLLVAGTTGTGKSVCLNVILASLLYKIHPAEVKFVLIDPKLVELSIFRAIEKHFLAKVPDESDAIIFDIKKAVSTLNALCVEMDKRLPLLQDAGVRNIAEYNEKFRARRLSAQKGHRFLPYIVLVIDEFADLIMTATKEVEFFVMRLAQLARAVGIHLIIATQRPSVNVITGSIKANFPGRMSFRVASQMDSRTILDEIGAENLIGKGDMLVSLGANATRVQCAYIDTKEVEALVQFIGTQQSFSQAYELPAPRDQYGDGQDTNEDYDTISLPSKRERDELFAEAASYVVRTRRSSTTMIQMEFEVGFPRAARIVKELEQAGIIGPHKGSKPRDILIENEYELEQILRNLPDK